MKKKSVLQMIKFTLFSISAGVIQIGFFSLFIEVFNWAYRPSYLFSLLLSIIWNFTFNRRYTFESAANIPLAMAKLLGFYVVFTPVSTQLGHIASQSGTNPYIIEGVTMLSNFVLEYAFCKFVIYRNQEYNRNNI